MDNEPDTPFDDFDEEIDDNDAIATYGEELTSAVAELGLTVVEPGTNEGGL